MGGAESAHELLLECHIVWMQEHRVKGLPVVQQVPHLLHPAHGVTVDKEQRKSHAIVTSAEHGTAKESVPRRLIIQSQQLHGGPAFFCGRCGGRSRGATLRLRLQTFFCISCLLVWIGFRLQERNALHLPSPHRILKKFFKTRKGQHMGHHATVVKCLQPLLLNEGTLPCKLPVLLHPIAVGAVPRVVVCSVYYHHKVWP
ncbi:hypothetical protein TcCL_NonESM08087 [Trypanosoma cruzi]|nr:hypothetical protein TcCL_NonESM08087 [Trypanosoma cruzi]